MQLATWNSLPPFLGPHLFSYFDIFTLLRAACVCRSWKRAAAALDTTAWIPPLTRVLHSNCNFNEEWASIAKRTSPNVLSLKDVFLLACPLRSQSDWETDSYIDNSISVYDAHSHVLIGGPYLYFHIEHFHPRRHVDPTLRNVIQLLKFYRHEGERVFLCMAMTLTEQVWLPCYWKPYAARFEKLLSLTFRFITGASAASFVAGSLLLYLIPYPFFLSPSLSLYWDIGRVSLAAAPLAVLAGVLVPQRKRLVKLLPRIYYSSIFLSLVACFFAFPRAPIAHQVRIYTVGFLLVLLYKPLRWTMLGGTAMQRAAFLFGSAVVGIERCVPIAVFFVLFRTVMARVHNIITRDSEMCG